MGKYIAVKGCSFQVTPPSDANCIQINSVASNKFKCDGKGVYVSPLQITVNGYSVSASSTVQTSPVPASIVATAIKNKSDGKLVMREGDQLIGLTIPVTVGGQAATIPISIKISNAGQNKVKAE